jgi:hypothetical protein
MAANPGPCGAPSSRRVNGHCERSCCSVPWKIAAILAIVATVALSRHVPWAALLVCLFNVWAAMDLLFAFYQGLLGVQLDPRMLGAAFFIATVIVPPLLITHGMIFWLLVRPKH